MRCGNAKRSTAAGVFKSEYTEEEYAAAVERARWKECPNCEKQFLRADGIKGPNDRGKYIYCSEACATAVEIKLAPLDRRQIQGGLTIDGWDL